MSKRNILIIIIGIALIVIGGNIYFITKRNEARTLLQKENTKKYNDEIEACESFSNVRNGTIKEVNETTRVMIALPEEVYPQKNISFVSDTATAGIVSNGENLFTGNETFTKNDCWSHYYELDGKGVLDFNVISNIEGISDYLVKFNIK